MQWPWVSRRRFEMMRLQLESENRLALVANERATSLEEALQRSDAERRETFLRLLRVVQGLPIFPDGMNAVKEQSSDDTVRVLNFTGMSENEIDQELTRVAVGMGMRTAPQVQRFIERQKTEYYREHDRAKMAQEDVDLREQALRSIEESLQQGREAAQRSN